MILQSSTIKYIHIDKSYFCNPHTIEYFHDDHESKWFQYDDKLIQWNYDIMSPKWNQFDDKLIQWNNDIDYW